MRASSAFGLLASCGALLLGACDPVERGDAAWAEGDVAGAIAAWDGAELDAAHTQRLARALYRSGDGEAAGVLIAGLPYEALGPEGHLVAGLLAVDAGRMDLALAAFEEGLAAAGEGGDAELAINACSARLALGAEPLEACQRAVERAPTDAAAYLGLAEAATREGLVDVAREALYSAARRLGEGGAPGDLAWLAEGWAGVGDFSQACTWARRGGSDALSVGRWCLAAGEARAARAALEPLAPGSTEAAALLLTLELDELSGAADARATEVGLARCRRWADRLEASGEPLGVGALTDLGRLARREGRPLEAERRWREAIALGPGEPAPRINLARELERRGLLDGARRLLDPDEEAPPLSALALGLERARLELRAGERGAAEATARTVLAGCVELGAADCEAGASYLLARLLAARSPDQALIHLERAVTSGGRAYTEEAAREPDLSPLEGRLRFHEIIGLGTEGRELRSKN